MYGPGTAPRKTESAGLIESFPFLNVHNNWYSVLCCIAFHCSSFVSEWLGREEEEEGEKEVLKIFFWREEGERGVGGNCILVLVFIIVPFFVGKPSSSRFLKNSYFFFFGIKKMTVWRRKVAHTDFFLLFFVPTAA